MRRHQCIARALARMEAALMAGTVRIAPHHGLDPRAAVARAAAAGCHPPAPARARSARPDTARRMASSVAPRIFRQSISSTSAQATLPGQRLRADLHAPALRGAPASAAWNRAGPSIGRCRIEDHRRRIHRPASGPRPASSTPATSRGHVTVQSAAARARQAAPARTCAARAAPPWRSCR